jgi:hypothetical protein
MENGTPRPQINASKIEFGGGIAGALFALVTIAIFLTGIPKLRYFFPAALVLGCVVALLIRLLHHETPRRPWIGPLGKR